VVDSTVAAFLARAGTRWAGVQSTAPEELQAHWENLEVRGPPHQSPQSATELLRRGTLRVAGQGVGAGLVLSASVLGYFVEDVDRDPGQPDLRRGYVIVGIGHRLLIGLEDEVVEERFGAAYIDGAPIVAGPHHLLQQVSLGDIRRHTQHMLGIDVESPPPVEGLKRARTEPPPTLIQRVQLKVDAAEGAGLDLVEDSRGYLVEAIAPMPGQDGLHIGDVIVAIGGLSLVGLPE